MGTKNNLPDSYTILSKVIECILEDMDALHQENEKLKRIKRRMAKKIVQLKKKHKGCL